MAERAFFFFAISWTSPLSVMESHLQPSREADTHPRIPQPTSGSLRWLSDKGVAAMHVQGFVARICHQ